MSRAITAIGFAGILSVSTVAVAASQEISPPARAITTEKRTAQMPSHAMRGIVKSVSDSSLVIVRSRRRVGEMTFVLSSETEREGTIAVGSTVSVRYRPEGSTLIATAVSAHAETCAAKTPETGGSGR